MLSNYDVFTNQSILIDNKVMQMPAIMALYLAITGYLINDLQC